MKIAIVTLYGELNFGNKFQNYAVKVLKGKSLFIMNFLNVLQILDGERTKAKKFFIQCFDKH